MAKTNAMRELEAKKIIFEVVEYDFSDDRVDAITVADSIGAEHENVFKTLVAMGDKTGHCVFCVPGNFELDLKKAANVSGNKKVDLIKLKELLPLTGYVHGGCSPVGMKKLFPTYVDETAQMYETFHVSAGARGVQIKINPNDLLQIISGEYADLI